MIKFYQKKAYFRLIFTTIYVFKENLILLLKKDFIHLSYDKTINSGRVTF